jgi:pimeloyl-ACP methyl ester carboxylesterase
MRREAHVNLATKYAGLALLALAYVTPTLAAAPLGPDIERFRAQCRAEYAHLRGPGQRANVVNHVIACVGEKVGALVSAEAAVPVATSKPLTFVEFTPWLIQAPRGPAAAKGVVYFVGGFEAGGMLDGFRITPYFLKRLNDEGWDVIGAKAPRNEHVRFGAEIASGGAASIVRRVKELREQGYKRVVAAGHSWGAWSIMMAERAGLLSADVLLLSGPATFGQRISPISNRPSPAFALNASLFPPLVQEGKTPSVLMFFKDDIFDPGGRGLVAEKALSERSVAHLVLDQPAGFSGHYAGWMPVFDYEYGHCIEAFIETPSNAPCVPPPLVKNDFRSILNLKQLALVDRKPIASAELLVGRKFVAYTLRDVDNKYLRYVSANKRVVMESDSEHPEAVTFHDGLHCVSKQCSILLQWSEHKILEFEPNGALKAWWIEDAAS